LKFYYKIKISKFFFRK